MKLILDIETTRQKNPITGKDDPSPYNKLNKLVTVQIKNIDNGEKVVYPFFHKENTGPITIAHECVQKFINEADEIIGHNLKFDISWLLESGFTFKPFVKYHDTMIFEYICAKGMKSPMSLKSLAEKYQLPLKLDILQDYWEKGINTDAIPLKELEEYGLQDIETTYELYQLQRNRYAFDEEVRYMWPSIKLTNEALKVIIEMERNGCFIDLNALNKVEQEYITEINQLERGIRTKIHDLMGDTPINLNSVDDMSALLYGFKVKDKKQWAEVLNIGSSERNAVKKRKYPKRLTETELRKLIKDSTEKVYKTEAEQCSTCLGHKKVRKVKKDGEPFKNDTTCPNCFGEGMVYNETSSPAGLRLKPISSQYATAAGFATDRKVIDDYLSRESLDEETKAFLKAYQRHSSITNYLGTFVEGIKNNVKEDMLLHTSLNQCITATGRLSSSNPNFQNLPRGSTFPVRKAIRSRFDNGSVLEVDFAGLEYRVAVMLAECSVGLESILSGKDRHAITAEIIYGISKSDSEPNLWKQVRQNAKSHTFKPLYGGETGTESEQRYYKAFLQEHTGISEWHEKLCNEALNTGKIKTPTRRIFEFPNAKRTTNGKVKGKTQIVNYPVQSVATADIIWIVLVDIYEQMKKKGLRSKLILQVHDSVIADVHPNEKEEMIQLFKKSFDKVHELLYSRYSYSTKVPIGYEMKIGSNWNELKEVA